jgi:hypothetical protein
MPGNGSRSHPLPDVHGDELIRELLALVDEEEQLGAALGVDLTPPGPDPSHAPLVYGPLDAWLRRSEEVHRFLEERYRAERRQRPR